MNTQISVQVHRAYPKYWPILGYPHNSEGRSQADEPDFLVEYLDYHGYLLDRARRVMP